MTAVLVIEGHDLHAQFLQKILEPNYQVFLALTAEAGLRLLQECPIELLIISLRLPDTDGLTVIKTIRNDLRKTLPILVVTAYQSVDVKAQAFSAGCTAYLTKPFVVAEFRALVDQLLNSDKFRWHDEN